MKKARIGKIGKALSPDAQPGSEADVGKATHMFLWLCVSICVVFLVWATVGVLDVVSVAMGEVIPSSQVKTVQHLEGGIVREIMVREGETVKKGQPLIALESTASGADLGELKVRTTSLKIEIARLEAEVARKDTPDFPADLVEKYPDIIREAKVLFEQGKKRRRSHLDTRREQMREIKARLDNSKNGLKLLQEQIGISEELLKEKLTNRYVHLDLLKEASRLKSQIAEDSAGLKEAEASLENAESILDEDALKKMEESRISLDELTQRLQKFADSLERTVLRSPVDGVVKILYTATVGGVVKPGLGVVDIVPGGDRLVIEARLPTQDVGYVKAGQPAMVKLASSDAMRFGGLDGVVVTVSPDTLTTEEGEPYYRVRIETEKSKFQRGEQEYRLFPGMQVMASIRTGTRTIMEYLLDPFLRSAGEAMRER